MIQYKQVPDKTVPNEQAASMRGLSVRKVVVATKVKTKSKDKIC